MSMEIVQRAAAQVVGIAARIDPTKADYGELWGKRFAPREEEVRSLTGAQGCCGIYYGTGEPGQVDFVAGMLDTRPSQAAAGGAVALANDLVRREVPGGQYAHFRCTLATIGSTWHRIYGQELPGSDYAEDEGRPCLEEYPPDARGPDTPVSIYVPIRPK
ncbi:MAG: GyrI-like domain-containing protein [Candidatus Eisenbacteria bacterium]|nr:GyrI-like domain-containing protein [Candidatus Eisenbacteria bacterium]